MTIYKYSGRSATGAVKKGVIEATNKNAAIAKLRKQGINVRDVEESNSILYKEITIGGSVKSEDFVIYCRQFATLIRAGVSLVEATKILAAQTRNKFFKRALEQVEEDIRGGTPFTDAASKHPKAFPALFIN